MQLGGHHRRRRHRRRVFASQRLDGVQNAVMDEDVLLLKEIA